MASLIGCNEQIKRVFDLVKDFGTSESPKSTRSSTTHWCPGRPSHPAFRHNIASSLRLHTGLPYDWTPRSDAPLGSPLAPSARRVSRAASRLPGTTRLRFALHGGQRPKAYHALGLSYCQIWCTARTTSSKSPSPRPHLNPPDPRPRRSEVSRLEAGYSVDWAAKSRRMAVRHGHWPYLRIPRQRDRRFQTNVIAHSNGS